MSEWETSMPDPERVNRPKVYRFVFVKELDPESTDVERLPLPSGREATLTVRRSPRAQHISLRILPAGPGAELVLPLRVSRRQGLAFAHAKADWLEDRLGDLPKPVPFADGACFPLLGRSIRIRHVDGLFEEAWRSGRELHVSGPKRILPDQVSRWLRNKAAKEIVLRVEENAKRLRRSIGLRREVRQITLRDTRSRWGSCSPTGDLNFSWRLVMAPEHVLDYVVAHEVSHLVELNHSRRFWDVVGRLVGDSEDARLWLRDRGLELHRYGVPRS
jgi:predicted metal-dependent hydrolase